MKKVFSVVLVLLALVLAGCSNAGNQKKTYTLEEKHLIKAGWYNDFSEHVKVVYLTLGNKLDNDATDKMLEKLNKILTEKVNAELEIYYIPWNDYLAEYNRLLARKNGAVDLVGTATDWLDAWKNAKIGTFAALPEEYLKKYAPKTYSQVSSMRHWDQCKYNGKIYLMPEDNYEQWINHGFMYRGDWAREAGLKKGVHSWDDMTKYVSYLAKQNKSNFYAWDSNGALNTFHADGFVESKRKFLPLDGVNTYNMFGVDKTNINKVYCPIYTGTELVEYAKLMKKWNDMGVWRDKVFENKNDARTAFYNGNSGVEQHHTQTWYTQVRPTMDKRHPGSDVGFFWFGEEVDNVTTMAVTHGAMAISAASRNKARALAVYDLLRNDEECYRLINYGIEGVQYEIVRRNGKEYMQRPASYTDNDAIVTNFWWGRNDTLELRDINGAWTQFDEINEAYKKVQYVYPFGEIVWDLDYINWELIKIGNICKEYMPAICYGKCENPDAYVREFRAELKKYGIETVIAELQSQLDDYNASKR